MFWQQVIFIFGLLVIAVAIIGSIRALASTKPDDVAVNTVFRYVGAAICGLALCVLTTVHFMLTEKEYIASKNLKSWSWSTDDAQRCNSFACKNK